jgi:hypothetical protein
MSVLKSGLIVLLMAVPFFLYAAWQVRGLADVRALTSDPPADKGPPPKEKVDANKATAEKGVADARTLESLALQFRQPGAGEAVSDPAAKALQGSIAARSAELTNLEKFLSNVDAPEYADSKLKQKYVEWQANKKERDLAAKAIDNWFLTELTGIDGPDAATRAVGEFEKLLAQYTKDGRFADPNKAGAWRVQCRIEVIKALEAAANEPYAKVLRLPLPLPSEHDSPDVKKALGAPRAIAQQVRLLGAELKRAEEAGLTLPERLTTEAKAVDRRAEEWAAKEELLSVFADVRPLNDPEKAVGWLQTVFALYKKSQTDAQRALIREKVQQFCSAFIPAAAKLDAVVLINGNPVPRGGVKIYYDSDAKDKPLSDHPDELTEFNFKTRFQNPDTVFWNNSAQSTGTLDALQPTETSRTARAFTQAREGVTTWSAAEITRIKKQCEGDGEKLKVEEMKNRRLILDKLVGLPPPGAKTLVRFTDKNSKIWTRLTALADATEKFADLFQGGP